MSTTPHPKHAQVWRRGIIALGLSLGGLGILSGCTPSANPPTPKPTTSTVVETETSTVSTSTTAALAPLPIGKELQAQDLSHASQVTLGGVEYKLCTQGDGFGISVLATNAKTSCGFASVIMKMQSDGLDPEKDSMREHLQPVLEAHSPVTDQNYTVECSTSSEGMITCTGGSHSIVVMY